MATLGTDQFGASLFGGDPTPYLLFEVDAEITSRARAFLARGATDGTAIKVVTFSVGSGGVDLFDYRVAVPVNPDAVDLDVPLATPLLKNITYYEKPNPASSCVYCLLDTAEANDTLGEIAIWARVVHSPRISEIGTTFLAALAHFPWLVKNSSMKYALRVNVQF